LLGKKQQKSFGNFFNFHVIGHSKQSKKIGEKSPDLVALQSIELLFRVSVIEGGKGRFN
jgi:hypothetical protein